MKWIGLVITLFCSIGAFSQAVDTVFTINSTIWEAEREVRVHLPDRYTRDNNQAFSTVYVLDAQSDLYWNMAKGNIAYLVDQYQVMPMILVGVVSENRGYEFNPQKAELVEHFESELIPAITDKFRVNGNRILIGHSWGGAFVGNTLFSNKNVLFNAYIGISPSLDALNGMIINQADSILKSGQDLNKVLYASCGDIGYRELESLTGIEAIDSLTQGYSSSLQWKYEIQMGLDHWSSVIPSLNYGLMYVSRCFYADQYVIDQLLRNNEWSLEDQIDKFNLDAIKKYGFAHKSGKGDYNFYADDYREQGNLEAAIQLYELSIKNGNADVRCHYNLGLCYYELNRKAEYKEIFKNCLVLLEEQKADLSENFYQALKKEIDTRLQE